MFRFFPGLVVLVYFATCVSSFFGEGGILCMTRALAFAKNPRAVRKILAVRAIKKKSLVEMPPYMLETPVFAADGTNE